MDGEKLKIIKVVDAAGGLISAPEACRMSGLSLDACRKRLNEVALDCRGDILVDEQGNLFYKFPANVEAGYWRRSFLGRIRLRLVSIWSGLFLVFKIILGILLFLSLLILLAIFLIPCLVLGLLTSVIGLLQVGPVSAFQYSAGGNRNALSGVGDLLEFLCNGWQYVFLPDGMRYKSHERGDLQPGLIPTLDDRPRKSFVLDCFSFLFGDGVPNRDFEERRYRALAALIRRAGGALIVEQIAPFMAPVGHGEAQALPVVVHFDGRPEVSEKGVIVYKFAEFSELSELSNGLEGAAQLEMEKTGASWAAKEAVKESAKEAVTEAAKVGGKEKEKQEIQEVENYLLARRWQFSTVPFSSLWKVWMFSALNFAGYYCLWAARHEALFLPYRLYIDIFFWYSCAFVVIPALRYFCIAYLNTFIDVENELRQALYQRLGDPEELEGELGERLNERLQFADAGLVNKQTEARAESIVYDSGREIIEQAGLGAASADNLSSGAFELSAPDSAADKRGGRIDELPSYIDAEHEARIREEERLWKEG